MYDARPNPRVIPPKDEFKFSWDAGINLSWDLVTLYTNRHFVSETKALLTQTDETKNALTDTPPPKPLVLEDSDVGHQQLVMQTGLMEL